MPHCKLATKRFCIKAENCAAQISAILLIESSDKQFSAACCII